MTIAALESRIIRVEAFPASFPVKQAVTLGVGRAVKRDTSS